MNKRKNDSRKLVINYLFPFRKENFCYNNRSFQTLGQFLIVVKNPMCIAITGKEIVNKAEKSPLPLIHDVNTF